MEIKTLKDLKEVLGKLPEDILEMFGAGIDKETDEFVSLLCWDDKLDPHANYRTNIEKYPLLEDINKWITNIAQVQDQCEVQEDLGVNDLISSEDKINIQVN